jgi:hypothetical protein
MDAPTHQSTIAPKEAPMTETEVFQLAEHALNAVVQAIEPHQWDMDLPANFATRAAASPTLRELINYHAYDDAWVPDMLAGHTMAEAGADRFDGDLLGHDPKGAFGALVATACAAAAALAPADLDRTAHLSFGDYTVREYFWQINMFRALRAYDLAQTIGADLPLPEALVQGVWDEVSPHAEEWRAIGVFPAAVTVPAGAPLIDRLLGLTGRPPRP